MNKIIYLIIIKWKIMLFWILLFSSIPFICRFYAIYDFYFVYEVYFYSLDGIYRCNPFLSLITTKNTPVVIFHVNLKSIRIRLSLGSLEKNLFLFCTNLKLLNYLWIMKCYASYFTFGVYPQKAPIIIRKLSLLQQSLN